MQLTPANIDFIFYGYDVRWQGAYTKQATYWDKFATTMPSVTREQRYMWMDRIPQMREWKGERQIVNAAVRSYVLANRDWELTLELDKNAIADDTVGVFNPTVDMIGLEAKLWPDQLFVDILQNGHVADAAHTCHDGQAFFSANHPIQIDNPASSVQSNYFTSTALTAENFAAVRQAMTSYQASDLRPLGIMPSLLVVPPALEFTARQILNSSFIAPTTAFGQNAANTVQSNALIGMAELLVDPYLAGQDTTWYLLDVSGVVKPFIFQLRQAPQFVYKNKADDTNVFMRRKFLYGVDSRGAAGYSLWFYAAKAVA